jgi:hypothetical protein
MSKVGIADLKACSHCFKTVRRGECGIEVLGA